MSKITPFLWFDTNAEEAMNFYVDIFNNSPSKSEPSGVKHIERYPNGVTDGPMKGMDGKVLTGIFELNGQKFMAIDGGPLFKFNESISFYVDCENQDEVDYFWGKLSAVPESEQCGWLKDKFGLSWQIIPKEMNDILQNPDKQRAGRALQAMLQMGKIDLDVLRKA